MRKQPSAGFFLTPAAEKTQAENSSQKFKEKTQTQGGTSYILQKTQEKNSSQKLKEKTPPLVGFSLQIRKLKKKTKILLKTKKF